MAQQRGRSQARRNTGGGGNNSGGMPGWAWLVMGVLLTLVLVLGGPQLMKSRGDGGFFKPKPNPDAQAPQPTTTEEVAAIQPTATLANGKAATASATTPDYSFYEVLPKGEVRLSDEQLAAMAREEARRKAEAAKAGAAATLPQPIDTPTQVAKAEAPRPVAAPKPADAAAPKPATTAASATDDAAHTASVSKAEPVTSAPVPVANVKAASGIEVPIAKTVPPTAETPYILQAGAYSDAGQAENIKAKIALLGLNARVESAEVGGKKVYRVRMGPYATAGELTSAKSKLSDGGVAAMAVKAR